MKEISLNLEFCNPKLDKSISDFKSSSKRLPSKILMPSRKKRDYWAEFIKRVIDKLPLIWPSAELFENVS